jgi:hypothetical protein
MLSLDQPYSDFVRNALLLRANQLNVVQKATVVAYLVIACCYVHLQRHGPESICLCMLSHNWPSPALIVDAK